MSRSLYGNCPQVNCGAPGVSRERRPNGNDVCARGHRYPSAKAVHPIVQPVTITSYVCGLMFEPRGGVVVLIRKNRPTWQAGKLNGIGGKIEAGETSRAAMVREFHEEAGVKTLEADWDEFATLSGPDFKVHFLRAFDEDAWLLAGTMEDEEVGRYAVKRIVDFDRVENLDLLIALALNRGQIETVHMTRMASDEAKAA